MGEVRTARLDGLIILMSSPGKSRRWAVCTNVHLHHASIADAMAAPPPFYRVAGMPFFYHSPNLVACACCVDATTGKPKWTTPPANYPIDGPAHAKLKHKDQPTPPADLEGATGLAPDASR